MHPVLFEIFSVKIHTYGFFVALGFLTGMLFAKREARFAGESPDMITDLSFYIILSAIIGARLFYIFTDIRTYIEHPLEIFKIWNGGLTFYGGFLAAFATTVFYLKKKNISVLKTADIFAPSIALGHFMGRIGCFFAGCCYGKVCDLPWAITFRHSDSLAPVGVALHPVQLYSVVNNLFIFLFLLSFRKFKKFDGQLFLIYAFFYGVTRIVIEVFRGDFRGEVFFGVVSISQMLGAGIAIFSAVTIWYLSNNTKNRRWKK